MAEVAAAERRASGSTRRSPPSTATSSSAGRGCVAISLLVMCSTFISLNGNALTGPRAYFAMARDGLFPAGLCRVHPRFQTPANAVPRAGDLGDPPDGRRHRPDPLARPRPAAGLPRPDPRRLDEAERDAALRRALHLRHLRGEPVLHAGDRQRLRPPRRRGPTCPALPDLGLPGHPAALRRRRRCSCLGNMLRQTPAESLAGLGIVFAGLPAYPFFARRNAST